MPDYNQYDGLCSTCKFSLNCMFRKNPLTSVHFCEEYQQADPSQICEVKRSAPVNNMAGSLINHSSNKIMGLCSNCRNRSNCSFPKPESGVWHCEEYQ